MYLDCKYFKRPDRTTPTGQLLDAFIKGTLRFSENDIDNEKIAQMIFAANMREGRAEMLETLEEFDVVSDRYIPSGCTYHSVAVGKDSAKFIMDINADMPAPDLILIFEVSPEVAMQRAADDPTRKGKERNDTVEIQRNVSRKFREFYRNKPGVYFIDANRSHDEVYAVIVRIISETREKDPGPLLFYGEETAYETKIRLVSYAEVGTWRGLPMGGGDDKTSHAKKSETEASEWDLPEGGELVALEE